MHHDLLRDALVDFCHNAHLGVKVEIGSRLTPDLRQSHPANLLVADWERGRPAAWDVTVTSSLTLAVLNEAVMTAAAALPMIQRASQELGWVCVPLAVETCGNWGREAAHTTFTRLVLGLKSVLLCRKVGSLLTFVGDLVLC